jgi:hypothetical protein
MRILKKKNGFFNRQGKAMPNIAFNPDGFAAG